MTVFWMIERDRSLLWLWDGRRWGCVGASMTEEQSGEKNRGGGDNAERMPSLVRLGLILLSRATDEPQMDGQLLWVCAFREVGVREEGAACFQESVFGLKGPFRIKLSIMVHVWFIFTVFFHSSTRKGFLLYPGGLSRCSG